MEFFRTHFPSKKFMMRSKLFPIHRIHKFGYVSNSISVLSNCTTQFYFDSVRIKIREPCPLHNSFLIKRYRFFISLSSQSCHISFSRLKILTCMTWCIFRNLENKSSLPYFRSKNNFIVSMGSTIYFVTNFIDTLLFFC